ncbi:hypothetical protein BIW53_06380 [Pseudoalteromonas byunsanensis]|uniref:Uncharacterized protein n=1 Tax=Pseudoalteromonas byunsanensis TaxID=327939 RepID=A0A1S1N930_9GAMM|nr:hypothetical protein BIW53_06380 [Pseudoalteromonas byunsanensis]
MDNNFFIDIPFLFDKFIVIAMVFSVIYQLFHKLKYREPTSSSVLLISILVAASYGLSSFSYDLFTGTVNQFLLWVIYDLELIALVWVLHRILKLKFSPTYYYVVFCLSFNSLLFLLMYADIVIRDNQEAWWFWYLYSMLIKLSDFLIVISLFINKDYLRLITMSQKWIAKYKDFKTKK